MKNAITFSFFLLLSLFASAQLTIHQTSIDSLERLIVQENDQLTKAHLLMQQADYYYDQNDIPKQTATLQEATTIAESLSEKNLMMDLYLLLGQMDGDQWCAKAQKLAESLNDPVSKYKSSFCMASNHHDEDYDQSLHRYTTILKEMEQDPAELFHVEVYEAIGDIYKHKIKLDSNSYYLYKALKLAKSFKQTRESQLAIASLYESIAAHFYRSSKFNRAVIYCDSATNLAKEIKNVPLENKSLDLVSNVHFYLQNWKLAIDAVKQKITNNGGQEIKAYDYDMLGILSYKNLDYEEAIQYLKKAISIYEEEKALRSVRITAINLAHVYDAINEFDPAQKYSNKALDISLELNDTILIAASYASKALLSLNAEKYQETIDCSKKSIQLHRLLGVPSHQVSHAVRMARAYTQLGQLDSAEFYNHLAYDHFKDRNNKNTTREILHTFYEIEKEKGNYEKALINLERYNDFQKELKEEERKKSLKKERTNLRVVEAKGEAAEAEKKKEQAELEATLLATQKRLYGALAALLAGILFIGGYLYRQLMKTKRKVESQNLQLQQLNATKDKFFGIIAHDIRTPIIALSGVGNLMLHYLKKDDRPKLERLSTRIDNTAKQLSDLLDNLLNWALLQQGVIPYHPQKLSVKEVTDGIFEMFQNNAISKGVLLESTIDESDDVYADESAFNTILRNLIGNAIKYTPKGGKVTISSSTKDNKLFININDTGTGIAAEKLDSLFSFEKQSEQGTEGEKGTGLGLNLVKELTILNQGVLDVKSILNQGSQFTVGLPIGRLTPA